MGECSQRGAVCVTMDLEMRGQRGRDFSARAGLRVVRNALYAV